MAEPAKALLDVARAELGTKEVPANSNRVKYNAWYYGREVSGSAYPWCMAFVQWCFARTGRPLPYRTASCSALLNWYRGHDKARVVTEPRPGDIVIYSFGHTGIVESATADTVTAIEGNTGTKSDNNGGEVMRRKRDRTRVTAYIRAYDFEEEEMDISKLTNEECYQIVQKANKHAATLAMKESWGLTRELAEAVAAGITDGSNPMGFARRCEAAVMVKRAAGK